MRDFATYLEHKILSFKYIVNAEKYFGLFEIHKCEYKKMKLLKDVVHRGVLTYFMKIKLMGISRMNYIRKKRETLSDVMLTSRPGDYMNI